MLLEFYCRKFITLVKTKVSLFYTFLLKNRCFFFPANKKISMKHNTQFTDFWEEIDLWQLCSSELVFMEYQYETLPKVVQYLLPLSPYLYTVYLVYVFWTVIRYGSDCAFMVHFVMTQYQSHVISVFPTYNCMALRKFTISKAVVQ